MTQQIIQQLAVHLKSGRTVVVPFNAEKADVLNPQIEAFLRLWAMQRKRTATFSFKGLALCCFA